MSVTISPTTTTSLVPQPGTFTLPSGYGSWSIGLDRQLGILSEFQNMILPKASSYPPYNIVKLSEDRFEVELAVAGFSKEDIEISVKNGILTVKGNKPLDIDRDSKGRFVEYIHKGIAARTFTQTFALGEYVNVLNARHDNGILTINLERILPEALKERTIEIK